MEWIEDDGTRDVCWAEAKLGTTVLIRGNVAKRYHTSGDSGRAWWTYPSMGLLDCRATRQCQTIQTIQTIQLGSDHSNPVPEQTLYYGSLDRIYPKCRGFCLAKDISFPAPQLGLRTLLVCILPSGSLVPGCHHRRPKTQCGL